MLLVREMLLGPRRYSQFQESLQGITTNLLAARLRQLQEEGLVEKGPQGYSLTERGRELEPVLMALGAWGQSLLARPAKGHRKNVGWALISLKRRYSGELSANVEMRIGSRTFTLDCQERLEVREGSASSPDLVVSCSEEEFFAVFMAGQPGTAIHWLGTDQMWGRFQRAFGTSV